MGSLIYPQLYLFDETELDARRGPPIQEKIMTELHLPMNLRDLLICLIMKHGIAHTTWEYKAAIKKKEGTVFKLRRDPPKTPTGRLSSSMDHNKVKIIVEAIPQERQMLHQ